MIHIEPSAFTARPHHLWNERWFLLTSGDLQSGDYNSMTVAWGGFGTMWGKPFVTIVVRPVRHTFSFLERYDNFTLCSFKESFKKELVLLGSQSGRTMDKIKESGLTPIPSMQVSSPSFREADLILECKKMYWDDLEPDHFLDESIHEKYPEKDYHRMYFGEILAIREAATARGI